MEGEGEQPGGYTPSMTADQHRRRMEMMELDERMRRNDERLRRVEECVYELKDMMRQGESQQLGRTSTGRFTSGPGRAGSPNRAYDEGYEAGHYDGEQRARRSLQAEYPRYAGRTYPPSHVHDVDGYSGPAVPYTGQPPSEQHWRGYGHRGGWGYGYPDPYTLAYLAMQYGDPIAIN